MNDEIEILEKELLEISRLKFSMEEQIESINHQLEMSLYRKENGESVDYLWLNKARFKLNMLKIEMKKTNLEYEAKRKELAGLYRKESDKKKLRLEKIFMDFIKEDFGDEIFFKYVEKAKKKLADDCWL